MRDIVDQRYRIEQKLAVGGFGTIYRATDMLIGRQVALKILHRELAGDPNVVARFKRETGALAKLKSSHTLTMYDVGTFDDTLYFVMELLRGESLYEVFTQTGPLSWRRIAHIARGVCASLREAHALGIVHRDLKPANIMLETHALDVDYVKVLDFGIAKIVGGASELENRDLTRHGQMIGTFDYMAPEQMVGGACTNKSDMFTLGVVMYEMITGSRPYGDATGPAQMLMALMTFTPTPITGVPSELARVIMKCLSREQQDRPDVDQLDMVLESVLAVDEAAFSDEDEATMVSAKAPRPSSRAMTEPGAVGPAPLRLASRPTLPRGSQAAIDVGSSQSRQSMPSVMVARDLVPVPASAPERPVVVTRTPQGTPLAGSQVAVAAPHAKTMYDARVAAQVGLAQTLDIRPANEPTVIARGSDVAISPQVRHAQLGERMSEAAIARDIELALAATVTAPPIDDSSDGTFGAGSDLRSPSVERMPRASDVAVRIAPTPEGPQPTPKSRVAKGTAYTLDNEKKDAPQMDVALANHAIALRLPVAPESSAVAFMRFAVIAACLFGLGFLGALALWSL